MNGIKIGNIHTINDWNLTLTSKEKNPPEIKEEVIDIPGADGQLDFTESLTGDVKFNNGKITLNFAMKDDFSTWTNKLSIISNYLHGKKFKIIFDDDKDFYYHGRLKVNSLKNDKSIGRIVIECDVDPYKYDLSSSVEDWLWDPFSFETGIINNLKNLVVNGSLEVKIYGRRKHVVPTISCNITSVAMTVEFNSSIYTLSEGSQQILNIEIVEGENILKFKGNGAVSIEYRGGSL